MTTFTVYYALLFIDLLTFHPPFHKGIAVISAVTLAAGVTVDFIYIAVATEVCISLFI